MGSQDTGAELRHFFVLMAPACSKQPSETVRPPHVCSSMLLYCGSKAIDILKCTAIAQFPMNSFPAWQRPASLRTCYWRAFESSLACYHREHE